MRLEQSGIESKLSMDPACRLSSKLAAFLGNFDVSRSYYRYYR